MAYELDRCWEMRADEMLSPEMPPLFQSGKGVRYAEMFRTSLLVHQEQLGNGNGPVLSPDFLKVLAERLNMLPEGTGVTVFGGGKAPGGVHGVEYAHGLKIGQVVAETLGEKHRQVGVTTGSGPDLMAAPHIGAKQALNGRVLNNGVTMEGLTRAEVPGDHNDTLAIVREMIRRRELLFRLAPANISQCGGGGSYQEWNDIGATITDPRNHGLHFPIIFSEPYIGDNTPMTRVYRLFEAVAGAEFVRRHITLQQGDNFEPLKDALKDIDSDPNGYWNKDLSLPEEAFLQFEMTPKFINNIDLSGSLDGENERKRVFSAMSHLGFYIVQTFLNPDYVRAHGPAKIRVSRRIYGPLKEVLDGFWREDRIKSPFTLTQIIEFQIV